MTAVLTTPDVSSWIPFDVATVAPIVCKAVKSTATEVYESWTLSDGSTCLVMLRNGRNGGHFFLKASRVYDHDFLAPAFSWIEPESKESQASHARAVASFNEIKWEDPWTAQHASARYETRHGIRI